MIAPDFSIKAPGLVSERFRNEACHTFSEAAAYVRSLVYRRNKHKQESLIVFDEHCGTCSTKHALLKSLVDENQIEDFRLMIGLFKMNSSNTPKIAAVLALYRLEYIPEAHCYLRYKGQILDFTHPRSSALDFEAELLEEMEISPDQIGDYKVHYHQQYLRDWLANQQEVPYTLEELWGIREACIQALS